MKILFFRPRTLLAICAILFCQSTVICQTNQNALKPLVNGQTRELKLSSGVYFSPGPGKYVELVDAAAAIISSGASVQSDAGIQVTILDLRVYPAELYLLGKSAGEDSYKVKGFQILCGIRLVVLPNAGPGEKKIAIVLPGINTVGTSIHSTPVRTDGIGARTDSLGLLDTHDWEHELPENELRSETLAVTLTTYRTEKELRIAEAKTHSLGDGILGAVGVLLGLLLLVAPVGTVIKNKWPFEGWALWLVAISFFFGVLFFIGGVSKAHSVFTRYENELTWYQSIPFLTKALVALAYFSASAFSWYAFSDTWAWKEAVDANTIVSYRKYLRIASWFSKHRKDAHERIKLILNKAIADLCLVGMKQLVDHMGTGASDAGTSIIVRVLDHIISNELYLEPYPVFITYTSTYVPFNEELARSYPNYKISTAKSAFTAEKNIARQDEITRLITQAFGTIVPENVLVFADKKPRRSYAEVHIKCTIFTSGGLYYWRSQEQLPEIERDYFEGVSVQWLCQFLMNEKVADEFTLSSNPENVLTIMLSAEYQGAIPTAHAIFDEMAASAFRDFRTALIRHFSLPLR